jgi:hypothetical protein
VGGINDKDEVTAIALIEYGFRIEDSDAEDVGRTTWDESDRFCSCADDEDAGSRGSCGDDERLLRVLKAFLPINLTLSSRDDFCVSCFFGISR